MPKDQDETKFSIFYTLACGLKNGSYGIADMDPPNLSAEIVGIINKTELIPDEAMEDRKKNIRGARLEITMKNGEILGETVLVPKGDPEKPLTQEDIIDKLHVCSQGQTDNSTLSKLVDAIVRIGGEKTFVNPMTVIR